MKSFIQFLKESETPSTWERKEEGGRKYFTNGEDEFHLHHIVTHKVVNRLRDPKKAKYSIGLDYTDKNKKNVPEKGKWNTVTSEYAPQEKHQKAYDSIKKHVKKTYGVDITRKDFNGHPRANND